MIYNEKNPQIKIHGTEKLTQSQQTETSKEKGNIKNYDRA